MGHILLALLLRRSVLDGSDRPTLLSNGTTVSPENPMQTARVDSEIQQQPNLGCLEDTRQARFQISWACFLRHHHIS